MLSSTDRPGEPAYFDMSFSGLKTAVSLAARDLESRGGLEDAAADLAAEFQEAVVDVLVGKVMRAVETLNAGKVVLGGGVARNARLQERMREQLGATRSLFVPSARLATDNAAMIAAVAAQRLAAGERSDWSLNADPGMAFPGMSAVGSPVVS
jgi:N6-L-threonylcarbamoyladenine synthase